MCIVHKSLKKKLFYSAWLPLAFLFLFYQTVPFSLSLSLSFILISSLKLITPVFHLISEPHSLNSGLSLSTSPPSKLNVIDPPAVPSR